jgi:diguanylate cyclase (GGDEF)-like protein
MSYAQISIWIYLAGGALGLGTSLVAGLRRPGRGWQHLCALGVAVAWWCLGEAVWQQCRSVETLALAGQVQYVGIVLTPVFWFWFVLAQTARRQWLKPQRAALFLVLPAIVMAAALAWTPERDLLWRDFRLPPEVPAPTTVYGPLFWLMAAWDYVLVLGGCALLIGHYKQSPRYRVPLIVTGVIPIGLIAANALYLSGNWPLPQDPTPMAFALAFAALLWALLRGRLLALSPVGRDIAFDSLGEGVLILDERAQVVDLNRAAARLLQRAPQGAIGSTLDALLPGLTVDRALDGCEEQRSAGDGHGRYLRVGAAPIRDAEAGLSGTVVTLRDVTAEREAELALREAQQRLQRANEDLERMAHTDVLTGLANRRLLLARIEEEVARAARSGAPLSLLMIDLDHFKQVNDRYGHLAGDAVLAAAGTALRAIKRPADLAARYGGEELALLLPDADRGAACAVASRVRRMLGEIRHRDAAGREFQVTASVGVAALGADAGDAAALIARADAALYGAKEAGRDRVCVATEGGLAVL